MRTRELEEWAARAGVDVSEAAAAAVAGGSAVSNGAGGGGGGGARGGMASGGSGAGGGGNVRVTGRDQSQTLGELLLFVLESCPRFFLGLVPLEEGEQVVAGAEAGGAAANGGPYLEEGGFAQQFGTDTHEWNVEGTGFDGQGGQQQQQQATDELTAPSTGLFLSNNGAVEECTFPPPSASPAGAWGNVHGNSVGETIENLDDVVRGAIPSHTEDENNSDETGTCDKSGEIGAGSTTRDAAGSPGGRPTIAGGGGISPGGEPVLAADRCPPAWPSLTAGSPAPATRLGTQGKEEPPWSPAWATTGLRSLEDTSAEGDGDRVWDGELEAIGRGAGGVVGNGGDERGAVEGGRVGGRGVWGHGTASTDLVWDSSGGDAAWKEEDPGPARALQFTSRDVEEMPKGANADEEEAQQGVAAAVARSTSSEFSLEGVALDELPTVAATTVTLSSNTPQTAPTALAAAPAKGAQETALSSAAQAMPGGVDSQTLLMGGAPQEGAGGADDNVRDAGWPAVALKEMTRSLCNLYACHGAPAAGGEAAATADSPERLQPLAAAGATLCQLWPPASALLLRRLLGTWPAGSSRREVAYLRLIAGVACAAPPLEVVCPGSRIPFMLFRRLAQCINCSNAKVRCGLKGLCRHGWGRFCLSPVGVDVGVVCISVMYFICTPEYLLICLAGGRRVTFHTPRLSSLVCFLFCLFTAIYM